MLLNVSKTAEAMLTKPCRYDINGDSVTDAFEICLLLYSCHGNFIRDPPVDFRGGGGYVMLEKLFLPSKFSLP